MRLKGRAEKIVRAASMLVTVLTLAWLTYFFSESLTSCLLLVWKHTVERVDVPVLGTAGETGVIDWCNLCMVVMVVCGMRKRLKAVFRGKPGKWCVVLALPLLVVAVVTYAANWGAGYGILYRSGGNVGLYYDQIFSHVGWGVLSGLSLFAVGVYVFGMERIYVEQEKAGQYRAQVEVYQMLEEQYRQAERLRHDLKNHVIALRGLWEEQAWEKLGEYLGRMEDNARLGTNEEATGNRAMDALLCQKRKMAEDKKIEWECDVRIPKQCRINEFDLCVLFGNILDNALEACERLRQGENAQEIRPFIRVHAGTVKSCFLLEVKNSMNAAERPKGEPMGKDDLHGHGLGLLNVGDVVHRYDGAMHKKIQDGVFDISVLLPMGDAAYDIERVV